MINVNKNKLIFLGGLLMVSVASLFIFLSMDIAYAVHNDDHIGCEVDSPTKSSSATLGEPDSPYVITGSCVVPGDHGQNHATYGIWNRTDGYWIIGPTTVWGPTDGGRVYFSESTSHTYTEDTGGTGVKTIEARASWATGSCCLDQWFADRDVWTVEVSDDRGEGTSMNVSVSGPSSVTLTPDFPVVAPRYEGVFDWTGPSAEYRFRTINSNGNTVQNTGWQNMPSSNRVSYYSAFNTPGNYQVCASGRVDAGDNRYPRQGQDTSCTNVTVTFVGDPDEETTLRINSSNPSSGVGMDFAGNSTHYAGQRVETSRTFERDGNIDVRVFAAPTAPNGNEFRYWTGCNNLGSDPRDCRASVSTGNTKTITAYYGAPDDNGNGDNGNGNGDNGNGNGDNGDNGTTPPPPPTPQRSLEIIINGPGSVSGSGGFSGFSCSSGTCTRSYNQGTSGTLTANPNSGAIFDRWQGDCSGGGSCSLTMNSNRTVVARFSQPSLNSVSLSPSNPEIKEGESQNFTININANHINNFNYSYNCGNGQTGSGSTTSQQSTFSCDYDEPGDYTVSVQVSSPQTTNTVTASTSIKVKIDIFKFIRRSFREV